jgi:hypothetical protein
MTPCQLVTPMIMKKANKKLKINENKICKWHREPYCCSDKVSILFCTGMCTIQDCKYYVPIDKEAIYACD